MMQIEKNKTKHPLGGQKWAHTYCGGGWFLANSIYLGPLRLNIFSRDAHGRQSTIWMIDLIIFLIFVHIFLLITEWMI